MPNAERNNNMKKKYDYFSPWTGQRVSLPNSSFMKKLFCQHNMVPRVRREKHPIVICLSGDTIQDVCTKCGKLGDVYYMPDEGMGYQ